MCSRAEAEVCLDVRGRGAAVCFSARGLQGRRRRWSAPVVGVLPVAKQRVEVRELLLLRRGLDLRVDRGAGVVAVEGGAYLGGGGEDDVEGWIGEFRGFGGSGEEGC